MNSEKIYTVKNRSASRVFYKISEDGIRREFVPGETKKIKFSELEKLSYQAGGRELMAQYLQIQSAEATEDLGINAELEYNYSEEDIINILKNGSLDQFLDMLDFAPVGVIDLVKGFSVQLPLSDYDKRKALKEKTGFDIDAAIKNSEAEKAEDFAAAGSSGRRVQPVSTTEETAAPVRRTSGYKVITKIQPAE